MNKGFYFSMDAVMALIIMSASMTLVIQASDSSTSDFTRESDQFRESSTVSRDLMKMASVEKLGSMNSTYTDTLQPTVDESDLNKSVLNAISLLWANGNRTDARGLTKRYFNSKMPEKYEFKLVFDEQGEEYLIYNTTEMADQPDIVTSVSGLVSGHKVNRSSKSYSSRALLSSVTKNRTETVFFGGFVGQGNLYYNVTLEDMEEVNSVGLEGDFSGPFDLYINGEDAGSYRPSEGNLTADEYDVCTRTANESRCDSFQEGDNIVRVNFTEENRSVRGGVMEIDYVEGYQISSQGGGSSEKIKRLPGIDGIINYYSSFYVPGDINNITANLHYEVDNRTLFVKAGNATIYEERTTGEQEVKVNNSTIATRLENASLKYNSIDETTVPLRIGLRNVENDAIIKTIADSVSVMDVSGSMGCSFLEDPPCKIDKAKNASKIFSDIILNKTGNRAGFVSYNETVVSSQQLRDNDNEMEQVIDSQTAGGNTCIGCGILESIDVLDREYVDDIFSRESTWNYTTDYLDSSPPVREGEDWTSEDYNDSSWENDSAILGDTARSATQLTDTRGSVFLRKSFHVDQPAYRNISLKVLSDSTANVYINGELVDNDSLHHEGKYWNRKIDADGGLIDSGENVVAVELINDEEADRRHWLVENSTGWDQGSFQGTQERDGFLELEPSEYSGTAEDVDAGNYCSISGNTTNTRNSETYSTYIDSISFNGIDRSSGDNGGYLNATDSISDVLVPGRSYNLNITFQTGGYPDFATVAFDWDGDNNLTDSKVKEVGACRENGCTVSTDVQVPQNASTGSAVMRIMGEEGEYHKDTCSDPDHNEVEDYSVYVGEPSYENGSYSSKLFDAGEEVNWTGFKSSNITPEGTGFSTEFSDDGINWYNNIQNVPDSQNIRYNISMTTENTSRTPKIEKTNIQYRSNNTTAEFDASLKLYRKRIRSMIVLSDGSPNRNTSMIHVPDHNEDGKVDSYDHTIEAACRANEQLDASVYTVGFGENADEELLNQTAECGGGKYYYSNTSELEGVFGNISNRILNSSFVAQEIETDDDSAKGKLYGDSYLNFSYRDEDELEYGNISVQLSSERFRGNVSSPKNGSFYVPEKAGIESAKVTSYSGSRWTDRAQVNTSGTFETFYNLSRYGQNYKSLGDPFILDIPQDKLTKGNNTVSIDTATSPDNPEGASPDNRFYYTLNVPSSVGYGGLFPNETAAQKDARERLKQRLTLYGDEPVVNLNSSDFEYSESVLSDQPRIWGPANVKLVVWDE